MIQDQSLSEDAWQALVDADQDVTINLWQQNMFAVRAECEVGFVADTERFYMLELNYYDNNEDIEQTRHAIPVL